uniref:Ribosomal protein S12 n=2 Tax=Sargassum TaxID=3015 RepID=A0A8K1YNV3_9PHAE|nr:ribosomal protein S12 [Sargassum muticum]YP_010381306.1 ribosomal protein S12 [Sargassum kjellmanianum]UVW81839.1 ribosomal protein S12 [Sargassum siliquastrum]AIE46223.1 ribosomal protein S12 [Sargassum muticum]UDH59691.1 ribosomal protein S12 [Sargassum kjellmanianum]UQV81223.1 ribosomal protein S12 [Sargassum muticum]
MSRPNIIQWFKKCKGSKTTKKKSVGLRGCPQKKGVCLKVFVCSPKKPNSARRKVVKVRLSNKIRLTAYIPGQIHRLQEHSQVLIRGGRIPDLPGVKYRLVRNKLDLGGLSGRKTARSKYGTKKPDKAC